MVYRGFSLPNEMAEEWKKQKYIVLEGYSSSSLSKERAKEFARYSNAEGHSIILLKIHVENESGKYYFSLDSTQFTLYPEEQEILL